MISPEERVSSQSAQKEGADHDEEALVSALKARSSYAWTYLYDRHYKSIYRYALARTNDPSAAEDLAASVFLEALSGIGSYSYRGRPVLAWLYRIARNMVSDHQKARRRSQPFAFFRRSQQEAADPPLPSEDQDPSKAIDRLDLGQALQRLTAIQQEAVILRYYMGLTTQEVAKAMGKSEAAVYSLLARAVVVLSQYWKPR